MGAGEAGVTFSCGVRGRVEERGGWPCGVCRRGLAVVQFCAMVEGAGFMGGVVEWGFAWCGPVVRLRLLWGGWSGRGWAWC